MSCTIKNSKPQLNSTVNTVEKPFVENSKLSLDLQEIVRSKDFLEKTNNWENVVKDENGEPLLVYSGTKVGVDNVDSEIFTKDGVEYVSSYFTPSLEYANTYTSDFATSNSEYNKYLPERGTVKSAFILTDNSNLREIPLIDSNIIENEITLGEEVPSVFHGIDNHTEFESYVVTNPNNFLLVDEIIVAQAPIRTEQEEIKDSLFLNEDGSDVSLLWENIIKLPFVRNVVQARDLFLKAYEKSFKSKFDYDNENLTYNTKEPKIFFKSSKGGIFNSYREALLDSVDGGIEIGFITNSKNSTVVDSEEMFNLSNEDVTIFGDKIKVLNPNNFLSLVSVNSGLNTNTVEGIVNNLIIDNLLSGEQTLNPDGNLYYVPSGAQETTRAINGELANMQAMKFTSSSLVTKDYFGNIRIEDETPQASGIINEQGESVPLDEVISEVQEKGFQALVNEVSVEDAVDIVVADHSLLGAKEAMMEGRIFQDVKENDKGLLEELFRVISHLGIKLESMEAYRERFESKYGIAPDAKALSDIGNGIIALSSDASVEDVSEELSHFLVESLDGQELRELLVDLYLTDSLMYEKFSEQYRILYDTNGRTEVEVERMVRKEILGKIISERIISDYRIKQSDGNFISRVKQAIINLMTTIKHYFKNPRIQVEIEEVAGKISDAFLNQSLEKIYNADNIQKHSEGREGYIYYSAPETKKSVTSLKKSLTVLEQRLQIVSNSDIKDVHTLKSELNKAQKAVRDGELKLAAATIIAEAEGMSKKLNSTLNHIKNDKTFIDNTHSSLQRLMKDSFLPALEGMIADIRKDESFSTEEKEDFVRRIENINKQQIGNNVLYTEINSSNQNEFMLDIANRYGVSPEYHQYIIAALNREQTDISSLMRWVGNPEHASNPLLGMLSRILYTNDLQTKAVVNEKIRPLMNVLSKLTKWDASDNHRIMEKDGDKFTFNLLNPVRQFEFENFKNESETQIYNDLMFGEETDKFVTPEEYRRKYRLNEKGEKLEAIPYISEMDLENYYEFNNRMHEWSQENEYNRYSGEVYKEINERNKRLKIAPFTNVFIRSMSAERYEVLSKFIKPDGNVDQVRLSKDAAALEKLSTLDAKKVNAKSPYDLRIDKLMFEVLTRNGQTVEDNEGNPTIIFKGEYEKYNGDWDLFYAEAEQDLRVAVDLHKLDYDNLKKFKNNPRSINKKYFDEIDNITLSTIKEFTAFTSIEEFNNSPNNEAVQKEINKRLWNFNLAHGGIGFNEGFYDSLENSEINIDKVNRVLDEGGLEVEVASQVNALKDLYIKRQEIVKRHRSKNNSSEIDAQLMSKETVETFKKISKSIKDYEKSLSVLKPDEFKRADFEAGETEYKLNLAFEKAFADSGKLSKFDFAFEHISDDARGMFLNLPQNLRNFSFGTDKNVVLKFFRRKGLLNAANQPTQELLNNLKDPQKVDDYAIEIIEPQIFRYFKRFSPQNYTEWINNVELGIYRDESGKMRSFGDFLKNSINRQNGEASTTINPVERFINVRASLEFTDGGKTFDEQKNPLYDFDYSDGTIQPNLDKWGNQEFFNRFNINFENYKNNPNQREQILLNASKTNTDLEMILTLRNINKEALSMYRETGNHSSYRMPRFRMGRSESFRNADKPLDRFKNWWKETWTVRQDTMEDGAMVDGEKLEEMNESIRVIPKYGLYDLEEMTDVSSDLVHSAAQFLTGASNYDVKQKNLSDVLKLESLMEQQSFTKNKNSTKTNTFEMFKEFVDANFYGIQRNKVYKMQTFFGEVDVTKIVSSIDRYVRMVNVGWNPAVAITALTSSTVFGLTESLVKEHMSKGMMLYGAGEVSKDLGNYVKEVGDIDRNSKTYKVSQLLGQSSFDYVSSTKAAAYSKAERISKDPAHKMAEMLTNHLAPQLSIAMLKDTRWHNGRWFSYNEFRYSKIGESEDNFDWKKDNKSIDEEWKSLENNSLYDSLDFSGSVETINFNQQGSDMMRTYYTETLKQDNPSINDKELSKIINDRIADQFDKTIIAVGGRTRSLLSYLEGRVSQEQASSASRHAFINPMLAHRSWFTNAAQKLFKKGHFNFLSNQYESGHLKNNFSHLIGTSLKLITGKQGFVEWQKEALGTLRGGSIGIEQREILENVRKSIDNEEGVYTEEDYRKIKNNMIDLNKRNLFRFYVNSGVFAGLILLGRMLMQLTDNPENKDDFKIQYFGYLYFRLVSEFGSSYFLTGTPQAVDMVQRPAIMVNLFKELVNDDNYSTEEVTRGAYAGMPKFMKMVVKQTSLRHMYDMGGIREKADMFRHTNAASTFWSLGKIKASEWEEQRETE